MKFILNNAFTYRYMSWFFTCNFPLSRTQLLEEETRVSISTSPCSPPENMMALHVNSAHKPSDGTQHDYTFHSCLCGPMKSNFSDVNRLIEWIEVQRLFGAERFSVYVLSVSEEIKSVLDMYVKEGILDYHIWDLPNVNTTWNFG